MPGDELTELQTKMIEFCKANPEGVPQNTLLDHLNVDSTTLVVPLNDLLKKERLELFKKGKTANAALFIRIKESAGVKVSGSNERKVVFQIIEQAGSKGIWVRDIQSKSTLKQNVLVKTLKGLETEKLIKSISSIAAGKKKLYMLYNLEPDISVTGGAWYSNQDFDQDFVEVLNQQCFKYLQQKVVEAKTKDENPLVQRRFASATSEEVWKRIKDLGISKVDLSVQDIEAILNTLVFDGKIERDVKTTFASSSSADSSGTNIYFAVESLVQSVGLMQVPCGLCSVINRCSETGEISPSTCTYMKEWMDY